MLHVRNHIKLSMHTYKPNKSSQNYQRTPIFQEIKLGSEKLRDMTNIRKQYNGRSKVQTLVWLITKSMLLNLYAIVTLPTLMPLNAMN